MRFPFLSRSPSQSEIDARIETAKAQARAEVLAEVMSRAIGSPMAVAQPTANTPLVPVPDQKQDHGVFEFDNPLWYTTPNTPKRRPFAILSTDQIRAIADGFDVVRSAIEHIKREVTSKPITIVARDTKDESEYIQRRIEEATQFFSTKGGNGEFGKPRSRFEAEWLDDGLTVGCYAIYREYKRNGILYQQTAIQADTIRPRVDAYGWPDLRLPYEQWILGRLVKPFEARELYYGGVNWRTNSPYPASPIEWLVAPIITAMKADEWNRVWLTEGNTADTVYTLPAELTQQQISTYIEIFEQILTGDSGERRRQKFLPGGSQKLGSEGRKDQDFEDLQLWLLKRICSIYGVQPASIGYAGEMYKVSQDGAMDQTTQFGAGVWLQQRKVFYDDTLELLGYGDLECLDQQDSSETATERAQRLSVACGKPWLTVNEARKEDGYEPLANESELEPEPEPQTEDDKPDMTKAARADLGLWRKKSLRRLARGETARCGFDSPSIPPSIHSEISEALASMTTRDAVNALFETYA